MNNDKKKMMMLGGLGLVLVAVGAFQFIPKTSAPVAPAATDTAAAEKKTDGPDKSAKSDDPQRDEVIAMVTPLAKRDPFAPQTAMEDTQPTNSVMPEQQPTFKPVKSPQSLGGGTGPRDPFPNNPGMKPFDPSGGAGTLPAPGDDGHVRLADAKPLRQPGDLAFEVKGVVVGDKPMAVFEDDSGNQRLVPLGGSLDPDSKVVGIEKGKVRIRHKGKEKTLRLPEGP